ncbi:S-adenosyl-L-methionine-dependent methyltransferase [Choiromyces venosus 120613-1]|uniref:S-adenosyl-L-methionine-dependent methyltransferase n=1 Tax=Choiromyces venosus 120613-1 TaxID=1336337 RepID=A0A3N4J049_9PEZI|nr:S-adenosyl-L-methionine-dependent methyltransferase [Choiromyces venosus 120613-1]
MASTGASPHSPQSPNSAVSPAGSQAPQQGIDGVVIEADETPLDDGDSAFGSETSSYVTSLSPSVTNYRYENGRRYHAFREGAYVLPNDEAENDRLDLQHQMLYLLFGLHRAPLDNPQKMLDIGTGTGIWAVEMADKFPSSEIIGNDLSPIQPSWVPPNLRFEVDDAESDWAYKLNSFDYVHSRFMIGSIQDWPKLLRQSFDRLKPGGYVELQEINCVLYTDDNTLPPDSAAKKWSLLLAEASRKNNRPIDIGKELQPMVEEAGFVNVHREVYKLPLGPWPKDSKLKEIGAFNLVNMLEGLDAMSLALYTRVLGWSTEEVMAFLPSVRQDFQRRDFHIVWDIYVVWGQKPED